MFVGMARIELFIPASGSLKDKRRVLRSVLDAAGSHNNVAVTETDHHDLWQRACIGVSCVATSVTGCEKVLQQVEKTISRVVVGRAEIVGREHACVAMEDLV